MLIKAGGFSDIEANVSYDRSIQHYFSWKNINSSKSTGLISLRGNVNFIHELYFYSPFYALMMLLRQSNISYRWSFAQLNNTTTFTPSKAHAVCVCRWDVHSVSVRGRIWPVLHRAPQTSGTLLHLTLPARSFTDSLSGFTPEPSSTLSSALLTFDIPALGHFCLHAWVSPSGWRHVLRGNALWSVIYGTFGMDLFFFFPPNRTTAAHIYRILSTHGKGAWL